MKMKTNIEIEIRGKLPKTDLVKIKNFLDKNGKLAKSYSRLSVDVSPGFNPKTRNWDNGSPFDLRLKKSGNSEKISLKVGAFHLKKRKEIEVELKDGQFVNTLELLELLGFDKGMIYFWESWEYKYQGYEIKISKYDENYYTWEIESVNGADPNVLAKKLDLIPYSKIEYNQVIEWENKNIHKIYTKELMLKLINKVP